MDGRVAVVGAGISGAACARELRAAGHEVEVFESGRAAGGRMASPTVGPRRVDLGAAYFTVSDTEFEEQVRAWHSDGLARPWTDTLDVIDPDGRSTTTGPMRWASPDGLRALVRDLEPRERSGNEITALEELEHEVVVLAMPDPQAARLAPGTFEWIEYRPVISMAFEWTGRDWDLECAAFVNDDPDLTLIADDGSRRGDGAPVLVAHSTDRLAREHLDDPDAAVAPAFAALQRLLDVPDDPRRTYAYRWMFAQPVTDHDDAPFGMVETDSRLLGTCGDSWCPEGSPRVEAAWLSGVRLGRALADRVG